MLLLCMHVFEAMRVMTVDGVVGKRGWWRMVVLCGNEQDGDPPNELPPESSCGDLDLDARERRAMLPGSLRGVGGRVDRRE